jgi:hypothetical protein
MHSQKGDADMFFPRISIRRLALIAALAFACSHGASAQSDDAVSLSARSRTVSVAVVGDSLANDLGRGMEALFNSKPHVRVIKQTKFATGLVRTDHFNWNATVRNALKYGDPNIIVVVIGGNDRQPIRMDGQRLDPMTKPWLAEYERRVAHFMKTVKRSRAKIYWVGLPDVRLDNLADGYRAMNEIYRREAAKRGIAYIGIWDKFQTPDGAYSSFGKSVEGVKRRLRKEDGMHFTEAGRLLFASHVARAIGLR